MSLSIDRFSMSSIYLNSLIIDTDYHKRKGRLILLKFNQSMYLFSATENALVKNKSDKYFLILSKHNTFNYLSIIVKQSLQLMMAIIK
jgi:hypothetical protein